MLATAGVVFLVGAIVAGTPGAAAWTQWGLATTLTDATPIPADHLLVSEVMTGGAGASDEFVEVYNPTPATLPLEGLELVYVTASGATVTTKASWPAGTPGVGPGAHVLVANAAGIFAAIADLTYANGLAATGGSVALRIHGAATAIDAVGWGTAASGWLEGAPAPAVAAGHSLERLPGGTAGSWQDTDQNAVDFVDRSAPDPQNAASPPIPVASSPTPAASTDPSASATMTPPESSSPMTTDSPTPAATLPGSPTVAPTPSADPTPATTPTPQPPTPTPTAAPITVAAARALPDGSVATIEGVSLTDSSFTDGGGYVTDGTAGIAVLVSAGTFPRGHHVRVTGQLDDRYHQRTLRAEGVDVVVVAPGDEPAAATVASGAVGEALEGELAGVGGVITSGPMQLSGAVGWDLDDGSGPVRVVVMEATGIDLGSWQRGSFIQVRGVVGQRDSSGTGTTGYRLLPRAADDVEVVTPPSPSPSASGSPMPSDPADATVISISDARDLSVNSRARVRGTVTLPTGTLADGTAAIQDGSGAIILRLGDEAGDLALGQLVRVDGVRSTKSGMETLRVSAAPAQQGTAPQPEPARSPTGTLGEPEEALLVAVRGVVTTAPRRSSAHNTYFDLDDGSGPLRVYVSPRTGIGVTGITLGATLEIVGVLGQETSGQQPERGYRLWPRRAADVRVLAPAASSGPTASPEAGSTTAPPVGGGQLPGLATDVPTSEEARWPKGIPVPRLHPQTSPTVPSSSPGPAGVPSLAGSLQPEPEPSTTPMLLALAAVFLALGAAVAAAQPGLISRIRAAVAHRGDEGAAAAQAAVDASSTPQDPGTAIDPAIARLVPLAVADEPSRAERFPSTDSRSPVRRILPPT